MLSLGAGVQSTTVLLMALKGELPLPDVAIFADTGFEPKPVYEHLEKLKAVAEGKVPIKVVKNWRAGSELELAKDAPLRFRRPDNSIGMVRRQCTGKLKIEPITKEIRTMLGIFNKQSPKHVVCEHWFGISLDEVRRMRISPGAWCEYWYPLVEREITRTGCLAWLERNGWTDVPRSACIQCPYRTNMEWRDLRDRDPESWQKAIAFDRWLRTQEGIRCSLHHGVPYVHNQAIPLDEVDLSTPEDHGQARLWDDECAGMCGV